jgi:hypothetical protein
MVALEKKHILDVLHDYPEIFKSVFPTGNSNTPADVYLWYDISNGSRKYIGFLSGYPMDLGTWYIQVAGLIPAERMKKVNLARFRETLCILHKDWNGLFFLVKNDNLSMIKMCLASGFKVIGTRQDLNKNLYLEMAHVKGD